MLHSFDERPTNTPEQVREYLSDTLAILAEIPVPESLQVAAFSAVIQLLSSKHLIPADAPSISIPR